jgi:hypothetical protein
MFQEITDKQNKKDQFAQEERFAKALRELKDEEARQAGFE